MVIKMKCQQVKEKIHEYLDGHLPEGEMQEMENHFHTCQSCRKEMEEWKYFFADINLLDKHQTAPVGMTQAIMARIQGEEITIQPSWLVRGLSREML